ncbi:MAG TPA: purine-nucleoside phosphorylase [Clostridia bacterium]|nr:purine-nucleoside phosphorylase [Clostridia bacterium]
MSIPTPHINAKIGDFAKTVLMPGDPLRSKFIAENFLADAVLINNVRGIQGYTGTYKGKRVSVMASGMGMPTIGIYSYELFNFYGVENIIRIGSAGAISPDLKLRSIVIGMSASFNSSYGKQFGLPGTYAPTASYALLKKAADAAERLGIPVTVGNILSNDLFYDDGNRTLEWQKMGVLAVEMESAALYMNAARAKKNALCICTVSDSLVTGEACTAEERQTTFTKMMELALETA